MQRYGKGLLRLYGMEVRPAAPSSARASAAYPGRDARGRGRVFVMNHRSLLDIFVTLAFIEATIVSRADLARWPVIGVAARRVGTLFVDRTSKQSGSAAVNAMCGAVERGRGVMVYPEGTTFVGDEVTPSAPAPSPRRCGRARRSSPSASPTATPAPASATSRSPPTSVSARPRSPAPRWSSVAPLDRRRRRRGDGARRAGGCRSSCSPPAACSTQMTPRPPGRSHVLDRLEHLLDELDARPVEEIAPPWCARDLGMPPRCPCRAACRRRTCRRSPCPSWAGRPARSAPPCRAPRTPPAPPHLHLRLHLASLRVQTPARRRGLGKMPTRLRSAA